jgi:melibiose permease
LNITVRSKITYGIGGFGKNVAYGLVASYTLYYYNTVLGISASFVGVLLMVARIFDAFNDPLMGVIVAKTKSRYGRYKPWILIGAVLNAFVLYAMFTVPKVFEGGSLKLYVTITYFLCGITYTLSDIPYWSIIPAITRAGSARESLTVFARTFSAIGVAIPTIVTMSVVPLLGGGSGRAELRHGFSILAVIIACIYVATTVITVWDLPNEEHEAQKDATVRELLNALFKNDQAIFLALIMILFNGATTITTNLAIYMFEYEAGIKPVTVMIAQHVIYLDNRMLYTVFMALNACVQLFTMMILYPLFRKKLSNRQIFLGSCILAIAGYCILVGYIMGDSISFLMILLPCMCISVANGAIYVLTTIFVAGAVDYGEAKTGQREDSIVSSLQTLMAKLSVAFAALVIGVGLDLVKLDSTEGVMQTTDTLMRLRILYAVPSLIMVVIGLLVFIRKKSIGAEHGEEIISDTACD